MPSASRHWATTPPRRSKPSPGAAAGRRQRAAAGAVHGEGVAVGVGQRVGLGLERTVDLGPHPLLGDDVGGDADEQGRQTGQHGQGEGHLGPQGHDGLNV